MDREQHRSDMQYSFLRAPPGTAQLTATVAPNYWNIISALIEHCHGINFLEPPDSPFFDSLSRLTVNHSPLQLSAQHIHRAVNGGHPAERLRQLPDAVKRRNKSRFAETAER